MIGKNRDLLVLKKTSASPSAVEAEVEKLHNILFHVECMQNFCIANEIIDVSNYKIITNPIKIERIVRNNKLKIFQFIFNKN